MPRYTFECGCGVRFSKNLRIGEHPTHSCPSCGEDAPRFWEGESFGFGFQEGAVPGNSGVSKHDYPTADQVVGSDAEKRWAELRERDKVKQAVRAKGGHQALIRKHGQEKGQPYIEYSSGGEKVVKIRKELVKEAEKAKWGVPDTNT
jgi:putative FmdB family regulatory protein